MSTKVNQNPHFCTQAADYLQANGFQMSDGNNVPDFLRVNHTLYFFQNGNDKCLVIYGDNADFMIYDEGEPDQRASGYKRYMSLTGIISLSLFDWMLMFHIADLVRLNDFFAGALIGNPMSAFNRMHSEPHEAHIVQITPNALS